MALKLITAATAPIVTLAEAKRHVRAEDFTDDDSYLESLVEVATEHINGAQGWLGRAFLESTWEFRLDCFPLDRINIPLPPLRSVETVEYVKTDGTTGTVTDFRSFGVGLSVGSGYILPVYDGEWPDTLDDEPEAVRITFKAGYDAPPKQLKHAMLLIVGDWYKNREDIIDLKSSKQPRGADALLYPLRFWG